MEEKEAAPVFEKPKDQKKIEKENNIFKNKSYTLLFIFLYIFLNFCGCIDLVGKILEKIFINLDKIDFILIFILLFFFCITLSYAIIRKSIGKDNLNKKSNPKEITFRVIFAFILMFICYQIKINSFISWIISSLINLILKFMYMLKYIVFLEILKYALDKILKFIK